MKALHRLWWQKESPGHNNLPQANEEGQRYHLTSDQLGLSKVPVEQMSVLDPSLRQIPRRMSFRSQLPSAHLIPLFSSRVTPILGLNLLPKLSGLVSPRGTGEEGDQRWVPGLVAPPWVDTISAHSSAPGGHPHGSTCGATLEGS